MKVELIARKGFGVTPKGGRVRVPRDHAAALVKMGLAEYAPVEVVKAAPVKKAEPIARKSQTYARRDMVAETFVAPVEPKLEPREFIMPGRPASGLDDGKA